MDDRVAKTISGLADFKAVAQFEKNAKVRNRYDDEMPAALKNARE